MLFRSVGVGEVEGDAAGGIVQCQSASRGDDEEAEQKMRGPTSAKEVCDRCNFVELLLGCGCVRAGKGVVVSGKGWGLEGFIAQEALVDDAVTFFEEGCLVGGRGEGRRFICESDEVLFVRVVGEAWLIEGGDNFEPGPGICAAFFILGIVILRIDLEAAETEATIPMA